MNCTVVNTKEYKRPLVLETLITADLPLFSMNDRFNRVNRPFINTLKSVSPTCFCLKAFEILQGYDCFSELYWEFD